MQPGDKVRVKKDGKEYIGTLLPTTELTDSGKITLKLENGYNIGIEKKEADVKLLKKYKAKKPKAKNTRTKKGLPNVSIISLGGTISSKVDYRTGGVYADYTAEDFVEMMPELKDLANIKAKKLMSLMSEDMGPDDWKKIARAVKKEAKGVDGIILTQGTDTLHYTAAVLSFMLEVDIPIIITGAQRSIDRGSTDAFMNLICSVKAAVFDAAGVMTCLHGSMDDDYCLLLRGTKVRKMHTSRRDAFRPINDLPIAKIYKDRIEVLSEYRQAQRKKPIKVIDKFEEDIAMITIHPNMHPSIVEHYIKRGCKGIVIAATALGHVPTKEGRSFLPAIKKAGIPVFITTQTLYGRVNPHVYTNLRKLSIEAGATYLEDMLPEVAYVKLGWVMGQEKDSKKIREMMLKNYRGEFNSRLTPDMFLY